MENETKPTKPAAEKPSFDALLASDPDYRRASDERIRKAIASRFRRAKEQDALIAALAKRLGIASGEDGTPDLAALQAALDTRSRASFDALVAQSEQLRQVYPEFDLNKELCNPAFGALVARGVDARSAYELAHRDEMYAEAMGFAAEKTREKLLDAIRTGASRPQEDALGTSAAAVETLDPAHMSGKERADVRKRVAMGEKVVF